MKKILYLIFINMILVLVQNSFFSELLDVTFNPNLVLAFGFAFLFSNQEEDGSFSLLIGGPFLDLLSFNMLGVSSLTFLVLYELSILIRKYVSKGFVIQLLLVFISSIVYILVSSFNYPQFANYFGIVVVSALTTLISLFFHFIHRHENKFI